MTQDYTAEEFIPEPSEYDRVLHILGMLNGISSCSVLMERAQVSSYILDDMLDCGYLLRGRTGKMLKLPPKARTILPR